MTWRQFLIARALLAGVIALVFLVGRGDIALAEKFFVDANTPVGAVNGGFPINDSDGSDRLTVRPDGAIRINGIGTLFAVQDVGVGPARDMRTITSAR